MGATLRDILCSQVSFTTTGSRSEAALSTAWSACLDADAVGALVIETRLDYFCFCTRYIDVCTKYIDVCIYVQKGASGSSKFSCSIISIVTFPWRCQISSCTLKEEVKQTFWNKNKKKKINWAGASQWDKGSSKWKPGGGEMHLKWVVTSFEQ